MKTPTLEDYKKRLEFMYDLFGAGFSDITIDQENDDLIPIDQWLFSVKNGSFIDYDGFGQLAFKTGDKWKRSNATIRPSDISVFKLNLPEVYTHVLWYNR